MFLFQVLPGLYVGNFRDAKDSEQLKAYKITHIVSIHDFAKKLRDVRACCRLIKSIKVFFQFVLNRLTDLRLTSELLNNWVDILYSKKCEFSVCLID